MPYRRRYRTKKRYTRKRRTRRAPKRRSYKKPYGSRYAATAAKAFNVGRKTTGPPIKPKLFARRRTRTLKVRSQPYRQTATKLANNGAAESHPVVVQFIGTAGKTTLGSAMTKLYTDATAASEGGTALAHQIGVLYQPSATVPWFANAGVAKAPVQTGQPVGQDECFADFDHGIVMAEKLSFHWDFDPPALSGGTSDDLASIVVGFIWRKPTQGSGDTANVGNIVIRDTDLGASIDPRHRLVNANTLASTDDGLYFAGPEHMKHDSYITYRTVRLSDINKRRRVTLSTGWVDPIQIAREASMEVAGQSLFDAQQIFSQTSTTNVSSGWYMQVVPFIQLPF